MNSRPTQLVVLALALALHGCSSSKPAEPGNTPSATPAASKPQPKHAETAQLETGRAAFQKLYASAHIWAPDAQPLALESIPRPGDGEGRAAVWTAKFASASKRSIRSFTWSGATGEDAPEAGISPGRIDDYSPENASTQPFSLNFLKIDSDKAFEIAQKHGGKAVLKKNPDLPVKYALEWDRQHNRLLWRLIYGGAENDAKLKLLVNGATGEFVGVQK
ncbi:MAG: hypothetical protein JWO20_1049 [Candidatus Angelobacter sp.]|nr:hypothetical protein [Candidatus Angelobacter sp.]